MRNNITEANKKLPIEIKKELDRYIVGQNIYKQVMAICLYRHVYKGVASHILVQGPTGSGKSFMFGILPKALKKLNIMHYTIMTTNVSRLTEEGVKGPDLKEILVDYKRLCRSQGNAEYKGCIYCDEIDKLVGPNYLSGSNGQEIDHNALVQHQLMSLLDGQIMEDIPTTNISFVFGGAFYQLSNDTEEKSRNPIGFNSCFENQKSIISEDSFREKLIAAGFQREFLGRIDQVVRLNALSEKELTAVLLHPTKGVVAKLQAEFAADGIDLEISSDAVSMLIAEIKRENLGARSCQNYIQKLLNESGAYFQCLEKDYNKILIDRDSISTGIVKCYSSDNAVHKSY